MPFEGTFNGTLRVINMTSLPLEGLTQVEGGLEIGELSSGDLTGELASLDGLQDLKYVAKHFIALSTNSSLVGAFGIDTENMFPFFVVEIYPSSGSGGRHLCDEVNTA